MDTSMNDKAIEILTSLDKQFYWDMIDPLVQGRAYVVEAQPNGILIRIPGCTWYLMALDEDKALELAAIVASQRTDKYEFVTLHQSLAIDRICTILGGMVYDCACHVATRFRKESFEIRPDVDIRKLDVGYAQFVKEHYELIKDSEGGLEYARRAIERGMLGVFCEGQCAGFIGIHDEGTMGMLEILPEFRRRRLGSEIEKSLCNDYLRQGRYPFCHIVDTNIASVRMHLAMGFSLSKGRIFWLADPSL